MGAARVENEDDAVGALLNRSPALLIAPISRHIPELDVDLTEDAGRSWCILFILNDSTQTPC